MTRALCCWLAGKRRGVERTTSGASTKSGKSKSESSMRVSSPHSSFKSAHSQSSRHPDSSIDHHGSGSRLKSTTRPGPVLDNDLCALLPVCTCWPLLRSLVCLAQALPQYNLSWFHSLDRLNTRTLFAVYLTTMKADACARRILLFYGGKLLPYQTIQIQPCHVNTTCTSCLRAIADVSQGLLRDRPKYMVLSR